VEKLCSFLYFFLVYFGRFIVNFAKIKKTFSKNLSVYIILALNTTFVLNLMFLGLLSAEISLGEKNSHTLDTELISPSVNHSAEPPRKILQHAYAYILYNTDLSLTYGENLIIICTSCTKSRGLLVTVCIIHVN